MSRLPVIVGFGGYNAAGRSSFHHGFRRIVQESLDDSSRQETLAGLAVMMKLVQVVGRDDNALGRPLLYGTTEQFLSRFGLARVEDLPKSHEFGAT